MPQTNARLNMEAIIIGTAMHKRMGHLGQQFAIDRLLSAEVKNTGNSAHQSPPILGGPPLMARPNCPIPDKVHSLPSRRFGPIQMVAVRRRGGCPRTNPADRVSFLPS